MGIGNVVRVSLTGTLPSGEIWSVNPVWQIGGVSTAEDVSNEMALTMATAIIGLTIPANLLIIMSSQTKHTGARVEVRRWDGTLAAQAETSRATPVAGSGATGHPYQTSVVSSLRTLTPGASGRGRLYWPGTAVSIDNSTLRIAPATVTSFLAAVKAYLASITAALNVTLVNDAVLSVWSRTNASTAPVTSLTVGDVADVQRRRRDSLVESYSSLTMP